MNAESMIVRARLMSEHKIRVQLSGNCMRPLFVNKDMVVLVPAEQYDIGDLCMIELPGRSLVLHRLIAQEMQYCLLKGDRARRAEAVEECNIIGKVEEVIFHGDVIRIRDCRLNRLQALLSLQSNLYTEDCLGKPKCITEHSRQKSFRTEMCYWSLVGINMIIRKWMIYCLRRTRISKE